MNITNVKFALRVCVFYLPLLSCQQHEVAPPLPIMGNYYPMTEGAKWKYVTRYSCHNDPATLCYDTIEYAYGGNALPWSDDYKPLSAPYGTFRWIRKTQDQYYLLGAYIPEHKFLDTSIPVNGEWNLDNGLQKEIFTIAEINATKTVNGIRYENVIVVNKVTLWKTGNANAYEEIARSFYYYARNIGEIYNFHPESPFRKGGDIEVFLVSHSIPQ